jgi:hypothetical protein
MNSATKPRLPPNPYTRSPIKKLEDLAGRSPELKAIRYYLSLTASGQSPHLALIGQRGVGKTSLLNGSEAHAKALKLLPVRLNMNEEKTKSPGRFWHDLYSTLVLSMAKAGCWGGVQGAIYAELLRMLYARQPGSLDKAVLQIAYAFSCHQGNLDNFECPDALVEHDFQVCIAELGSKGFVGIALLIDEADCLGKNVSLLQMFRNIFQTVERCSLLLAGTNAVFPALSEVFSPIPRQFHRIDVKPFARWSDTMELVMNPIPEELIETVAPDPDVIQELHDLCGGDPAEVQLYCHHMYRSVENGSTEQMSLAPQVFREVLHEYRSNTPANVDAVLNAIERLPDKLLFESSWLSRRNLTLEENIQVSILHRELTEDKLLSTTEKAEIAAELSGGYKKLFEAGISEIDNCIRLAGAPLTAGFWKSFVEVERGKRWTWDDDSFADKLRQPITRAMGKACGAIGQFESNLAGGEVEAALQAMRDGKKPNEINEGLGELVMSCLFGRENQSTYVVDVAFQIGSPAGKQSFQCRFFEKETKELKEEKFREWIISHSRLLAGNGISIAVTGFHRWQLPSANELHRLGRITDYWIPEVFGPTELEQAVSKFADGDIQGCADTFSRMLVDNDTSQIRNNLAFCQLLLGQVSTAVENATKAISKDYEPLFELNKGIGEYLQDNKDAAKQSLRNALQQFRALESKFDPTEAIYVLVIEPTGKKVGFHKDLPVDAAILINLWRIGVLTEDELKAELEKFYPEKAKSWLASFKAQQ